MTLPAKGKVSMEVPPQGEWAELRVGLGWSEKPNVKGGVAWSEPVSRKAIEKKP